MIFSLLLSLSTFAQTTPPMVFMRESTTAKHIVLKVAGVEEVITRGSDWNLYPDISSDGQNVVWVQGPSERRLTVTLWNRNLNRREKWETTREGMTLHPRFAKNGASIFVSVPTMNGNRIAQLEPAASRTSAIRQEADGTQVYRWTPNFLAHDGQGFFPRPSSDSSFVIFQRNWLGRKEIVEYDTTTKKTRVLAEGMAPALSADENLVAYTSKVNGSWDIWMYDRRTAQKFALTIDAGDEMAPAFLPNNRIVFAANRDGRFQIYQADGSGWQPLAASAHNDYAPNFAGEVRWVSRTLAPIPGEARSSFGSVNHEGKVYVCGGHAGAEHTYPPESFRDELYVYDPQTNSWEQLPSRPHKAHGFQMAAFGDYLYAFGGFAYGEGNKPAWKSLDVVDRFDLKTRQWTTVAKLPRARSSNAAPTIDGKVYLIGGWDATPQAPNDYEGTFHREVDVFDLRSEEVTTAHWQLPAPLRRAFTAVEHFNQIWLIGGLGVGSSHFELLANVTQIDPITGMSSEPSMLPFATFAPAAGVLNNQLLVFGGMFKTGEMDYQYVSHVYAMNMNGLRWRHTGRHLTETKGFSQVVNLGDGLGVLGGHSYAGGQDSPVSTFEFWQSTSAR
jgi:hypothetical protein